MSDPVGEVMALADSYGDLLMRWNSTTPDEVADARAALESRVRELERDAARWQWLNGPETEWEPLDSAWLNRNDLYGQNPEDLNAFVDAAIDSARGEAQARTQEGKTP